jgi:predicted Zn-dependent protease
MSIRPILLLSLLACVALGCARLVASTELGRESGASIGAAAAKQVEETMGLVEMPTLAAYVSDVGARLVRSLPSSEIDFHFAVVDTPEPNAFALPGGYIYVSRGLLVLLGTEDELAGVIGHELGHVMARHHAQTLLRNVSLAPVRIATRLGGAVAAIVSPIVGQTIAGAGEIATGLVSAPYGREQEREADRLGQSYAAKSGWDPAGLADVMLALGRELELAGGDPSRVSILATHPASEERRLTAIENAKSLSPSAGGAKAKLGRSAFLQKLEGLLVGQGAAAGVFDGDDFLHPDLGFAISFPSGWEQVNSDTFVGATDKKQSAGVLVQLEGKGDDPLEVARATRLQGGRLEAPPRSSEVGGKRAATAMLRGSRGRAQLTWVSHKGLVFRISGGAPTATFAKLEPTLRRSSESFRDLSRADRSRIREDRLQIVRARKGDVVGDVLERHGSRWEVEAAAAANALQVDDRLRNGQLIKISIPTRYDD